MKGKGASAYGNSNVKTSFLLWVNGRRRITRVQMPSVEEVPICKCTPSPSNVLHQCLARNHRCQPNRTVSSMWTPWREEIIPYVFFPEVLPNLLEDVLTDMQKRMWFHHEHEPIMEKSCNTIWTSFHAYGLYKVVLLFAHHDRPNCRISISISGDGSKVSSMQLPRQTFGHC